MIKVEEEDDEDASMQPAGTKETAPQAPSGLRVEESLHHTPPLQITSLSTELAAHFDNVRYAEKLRNKYAGDLDLGTINQDVKVKEEEDVQDASITPIDTSAALDPSTMLNDQASNTSVPINECVFKILMPDGFRYFQVDPDLYTMFDIPNDMAFDLQPTDYMVGREGSYALMEKVDFLLGAPKSTGTNSFPTCGFVY